MRIKLTNRRIGRPFGLPVTRSIAISVIKDLLFG
jgi:hypothetical protein